MAKWPAQSCVPAFLSTAIGGRLGLSRSANGEEAVRLAKLADIALAPHNENKWGFRVSTEPNEWGVPPNRAQEVFEKLQIELLGRVSLVLRIVPVNTIPLQLYEDALNELVSEHGVVGIGLDFQHLCRLSDLSRLVSHRRAHHILRLTPIGGDEATRVTVTSSTFRPESNGLVTVFDDTEEIEGGEMQVRWDALIASSRQINGAFWQVR